jgi:hypothetical protein
VPQETWTTGLLYEEMAEALGASAVAKVPT